MTPNSIPFPARSAIAQLPSLSPPEQRQVIWQHMVDCRASTLALAAALTPSEYSRQADADFSPVGWHLGHIAFTESLWILEHLAEQACPFPQYRRLFAADGLPKAERQQLPDLAVVLDYLAAVRRRVEAYLAIAPVEPQLRLWCWLLQHESQHGETMGIVLSMHRQGQGGRFLQKPGSRPPTDACGPPGAELAAGQAAAMAYFPATDWVLGADGLEAIDNEQPPHRQRLEAFQLDIYPATCGDYRQFMEAGGYDNPAYWSAAGWAWRQATGVSAPLYWQEDAAWNRHPVCGISYYEAAAYARFRGKRLPTEAEWERAARANHHPYPWGQTWPQPDRANYGGTQGGTTAVGTYPADTSGCYDLLGNVWEWTSSWFEGYPGFVAFPYRGYSQAYFDGSHRVLRGGSWATQAWALRSSVRNWYHPPVRSVLAGVRCAQSA